MGQTIAEKIFSAHSKQSAVQGERCLCRPDLCFFQDQTAAAVLDAVELLDQPLDGSLRLFMGIDHNAPAQDVKRAEAHQRMRSFAKGSGAELFDIDRGIVHHVLIEEGLVGPGSFIIGSDRHASACGVVGALALSVSPADLALTKAKGKNRFTVPPTIKIDLKGKPVKGVYAMDIMLRLISFLSLKGCLGHVLEFCGKAVDSLSFDSRCTLSAMSPECGAVCGLMPVDKKVISFLKKTGYSQSNIYTSDPDCIYAETIEFDVSQCRPSLACPHSPDKIISLKEIKGLAFDQGFIGSTANGRLEDLNIAAQILEGKKIHPGVKLFIAPASRNVFSSALKKGIIKKLVKAGAVILPAGCGPSSGTHLGVPADKEIVLSTAPFNYKGSMGNPESEVYLASPATVAASCLKGAAENPEKYFK